ncbi:MAG: FIST N-terminal domain-containing protein [Burkholderiaceae bacterium]|jgi:small ligand-binding sensory domain FIST
MLFRFGHATHPDWRAAVELVLLQLDGQRRLDAFAADRTRPLSIGLLYLTESLAPHAEAILSLLRLRTQTEHWVGGVAESICASSAEYYREPALAVMLLQLPADSARVFSGRQPLPKPGTVNRAGRLAMASALVHVDPSMDDIPDLIDDLRSKVTSGQVAGGVVSAHAACTHIADEALDTGLSGLLLADNVATVIAATQACQAVGPVHTVTAAKAQFIETIDGRPALQVLLNDMGVPTGDEAELDAVQANLLADKFSQGLFIGLLDDDTPPGGNDAPLAIRPVVGIDPEHGGVAVGDRLPPGRRFVFCVCDEAAARADLDRMCAQLREHLEARKPALSSLQPPGFMGLAARKQPRGALYIACRNRGAKLFGQQGQELQIIREQLGDLPLIGFFANGEIYQSRLYRNSGVLVLFF